MNYLTKQKKRNINLNDFNDYINDDHKHYKITSNKNDDKLDEVKENYKIPHIKASNIKDFDNLPEKVDKYKIREINQKDFNTEFMGFDDPLLNYKGTRKIDNAYLYGEPSSKELMISNLQTESGTSNAINQKLQSIETGESIEDIKDAHNYIDSDIKFHDEVNKIINAIENEKSQIASSSQPEYIKKIRNSILDENKNDEINRINNKIKSNKAKIKPIIQHNKSNSLLDIDVDDIIQDDKEKQAKNKISNLVKNIKDKREAKVKEINEKKEAANKIQNFSKNIKAKKEGKEMIKNIVENINKDTHKKMLNKVFDEAKGIKKFNTKIKEKVLNYDKIYPLKNKTKFSKINPLKQQSKPIEQKPIEVQPEPEPKQTEEPQKRTRGRPKKNYTPEELAKKLEATRSSDRIRKANKRAADKQSKK